MAFNLPMTEWFAAAFLDEASDLIRRGLRSGYTTIETREPFLRGRLEVAKQTRASGGLHQFSVHLDEYSLDRPENRIMRSAVEHVARNTTSPENWRRARELSTLLGDIPESGNVTADFGRWERGRQFADYARAKPLAALLLDNRLPFATPGDHKGMSMLFAMERLFERYVFSSVAASLKTGFKAVWQPNRHQLCSFGGGAMVSVETRHTGTERGADMDHRREMETTEPRPKRQLWTDAIGLLPALRVRPEVYGWGGRHVSDVSGGG
ncbi:hypothetical protein HB774_30090 (plasmid) [Rhizobium leguminosarum bv. viciae]|nr:hypothetical protein HB774_30090 [Rhizobium leguminosarum bv. viciae]